MVKKSRHLIHFVSRSTRVVAMTLCGAITFFIFAASYETVFNADLPVVSAMRAVDVQPLSRVIKSAGSTDQSKFGNYGTPQYLKIPIKGAKVVLAPAISNQNAMLARANTGHFLLTSAPRNGQLGNMAIYMRSSWRTFENADTLKAGDNLFIDTDREWRYFYRINTVKTVDQSELYIARQSSTNQLVILTNVDASSDYAIIEASLVNVQNVKL